MAVRLLKNGQWLVDLRPEHCAVKKRVRQKFPTKKEANAHERAMLNSADIGETVEIKTDNRKLSEIVELWFDLHGNTLKSGVARKQWMLVTCARLGNPLARNFTAELFGKYRTTRRNEGVTDNTINHEHAYFKAAFSTLIEMGKWRGENPFKKIKLIQLDENERAYLTEPQIRALLAALLDSNSKQVYTVAKICLATGCRWGEAETITSRNVKFKPNAIYFEKTKNSRSRLVPVSPAFYAEVLAYVPRGGGRLFTGCYNAFGRALEKTGIELPPNQNTHVLRHTYASHFMMNGGDILALQKILGHKTIEMTMKYAHLSPNHLADAVTRGPLFTMGEV